jgi:hypothetical protein
MTQKRKNETSVAGRVAKAWDGYKEGKSVLRLISGPVLLSGVGYMLYRKFKSPADSPL